MEKVEYYPACGCLEPNCGHRIEVGVLNWYGRNSKWTRGLRSLFQSARRGHRRLFTTVRLGSKWANYLSPGNIVAISISDDPKKNDIIGYAEVWTVMKGAMGLLDDELLELNIGAKDWKRARKDMSKVYGEELDKYAYPIVSILNLIAK